MTDSSAQSKTIAAVRIAASVFFLLFGEYKLAGPGFAHGGFQNYLHDYISTSAVAFYRPVLSGIILPQAVFFGYGAGGVRTFIGLCVLLGLGVRPGYVLGILFLINMTLCTWWDPGHGVPVWRYFGNELEHLPLLLLLVVFFAADAGCVWGLDGRRAGRGPA